jgi:signal transduction histidine kinase
MKLSQRLQSRRAAPPLLIGLMSGSALALGWLGWQVVVQDRALEAQGRYERLETAADRAVAAAERTFTVSDVEVMVTPNGAVQVSPIGRLAYTPTNSSAPALILPGSFSEAQSLELNRDLVGAAAMYTRLAASGNAPIRGEALMRLARVQRAQNRWAEALQTYDSLQKLDQTLVAGMPAGLVAREGRCRVLIQSGDGSVAQREAEALWMDLVAGKWTITKATLKTYLNELQEISPQLTLPADWEDRMILADALSWAFEQQSAAGHTARTIDGQIVWVSWETQGDAWKARLISPSTWQAHWKKLEETAGVALRVVDEDGGVLYGDGPTGGPSAFRPAAMTGLPWSFTVTSLTNDAMSGYWTARRRFLIVGLVVFAAVFGVGGLFITRAISREFAVARLQSDFVAAVSHEFRTPLTSIHQLAEMLARGRVEREPDKNRAYHLILTQSDRLRRLVESLLDFGRMEARQFKFRSESIEAGQCFRSVVEEFQETVRSRGYVLELTGLEKPAEIRGDREALGGALWNLLDNAVKYSPVEKHIHVAVSCSNGSVEVSVRDHGSGIATEDLKRVFGKFYRGANARAQGAHGTGIGLAIVKDIVEAHRGTVRVRSKPGEGSEFAMVLPCRES